MGESRGGPGAVPGPPSRAASTGAACFDALLGQIRACRACAADLPLGPRPVVQASPDARILVVGQAPGRRVHASGVPFDDPSGERLLGWLGVSRETFRDPACFAIVPIGFCYPGRGASGDLPPRKECEALWRRPLLERLRAVRLTVLLGRHALAAHAPAWRGVPLGRVLSAWRDVAPDVIPLPHPSPRNTAWLRRHPELESEILPCLRRRVAEALGSSSSRARSAGASR